jgi:hypothetical protein
MAKKQRHILANEETNDDFELKYSKLINWMYRNHPEVVDDYEANTSNFVTG